MTMRTELSSKILDFLNLMDKCYKQEMNDLVKVSEQSSLCQKCNSGICKMIQENNPGLDCFKVYAKDRDQIYRYWFSAKVLTCLSNDSTKILRSVKRI